MSGWCYLRIISWLGPGELSATLRQSDESELVAAILGENESEKISAVKYSKLGFITTIDMGEIIRNNLFLSLTISVVDPAEAGSACLGCRSGSGKMMRIPPDPDPDP